MAGKASDSQKSDNEARAGTYITVEMAKKASLAP